MKKLTAFPAALFPAVMVMSFLPSCSKNDNFDKIPRTGFITHYQYDKKNRTPFLSFWADGNAHEWNDRVQGKHEKKQILYIKDININWMDVKPKSDEEKRDLDKLRQYFRDSLRKNISQAAHNERNFIPKATSSPNAYTLEIAITSITPTPAVANLLLNGVNELKSGVGTIGEQLVKKGHIAMAAKLTNTHGRIIAEVADYREDHSALLIDLKDYTRYKHHERHIDEWSQEITLILTHPSNYKVDPPRKFTLNPF
ncbi:hypothetical protein QET93_006525 [Akkermansia sp. N21116]|uniref:hypothetical protein n=1 Tax=Akkermansia sp. N21116 TaxID=3040764 RepID=UPI00244E8A86|nr:hypothetical protein [Akkermansia sp. N21116]WPX41746.1 hypothetical protein QET93_006525 [Akkermansia sp. N21116]